MVRWRNCLFRCGAIVLGLAPFLLVECGLWLAGWPDASAPPAPYESFHALRPLFVRNAARHRFEIAANRRPFFCPESFAETKAAGEYRIFCLGGSTVQGRPYATETSFPTWLELLLNQADPSRRWQVVNCGGVSYASYRLTYILRELLAYQPDLLIIYTGHNEFLEERTYHRIKRLPAGLARFQALCARSRLGNLCLRAGQGALAGGSHLLTSTELAAEVDALLDYRGGLQSYRRDPVWHDGVVEHFRCSVARMLQLARNNRVPVILCNPAANLKDCPPLKFAHRDDITPAQRQRFDSLWTQARSLHGRELPPQIKLLQQAVALDDQHAAALFHLAKCYEAVGATAAASRYFLRAKDEDLCPLRILESMRQVIAQLGRSYGVPVVDIGQLFARASPGGIPGDNLFLDHVHPSIKGHQMIAERLLAELVDLGTVRPKTDWQQQRAAIYRDHLKSLDSVYFAQGQRRLEGLRRWTQGRVAKQRLGPGGSAEKK